jgi:hypothetical protein
MASSGSQLSAARLKMDFGMSGSRSRIAPSLSATQRAAMRASWPNSCVRPLRNLITFSLDVRRRISMPMERSASVLGSFPICAMATGQKVEKALGS